MNNNSARIKQYSKISTSLACLSNEKLKQILADSKPMHEGWQMLPKYYDDGGFSGGTLERPALKELFDDIAAGLIDCVIVYKIDRLSRSLLDFTKIVDLFDRHNVTFVSVTQSFNTASSTLLIENW